MFPRLLYARNFAHHFISQKDHPFGTSHDKSPLPSFNHFSCPRLFISLLSLLSTLKREQHFASTSTRVRSININRFLTFHLNGGLEFRQLTGITRRDADLAEVDTRFPTTLPSPPPPRCRELIKNRAISHAGYNENIIEYLRKTRGSIIFSVD